jgi:MFS family permease
MVTVSNIALAVGWFMVPKFAELRGSVLLIASCQLASVAFLLAIPYSAFSLLLVAVLFAARSVLMLLPSPVLNAYLMNIVSEEIRASFYAISQLAWTLAFSSAYAISGYVWANDYSKVEPFIYCAILYTIATLLFYIYFRRVAEPKEDMATTAC